MSRRSRKGRPNVTPAERRGWLKDVLAGKSLGMIVQKSKRSRRVVERHLERARREAEVEAARQVGLAKALEAHWNDLMNEAETLLSEAWLPSLGFLQGSEKSASPLLRQSLWRHTPRSPLWAALDELKAARQDFLKKLVEGEEVVIAWAREVDEGYASNKEMGVSKILREQLCRLATGWSSLTDTGFSFKEQVVSDAPKTLFFGAYHVVQEPVGFEKAKADLLHLLGRVETLESLRELRNIHGKMVQLQTAIKDEVEVWRYRRVFGGVCSICDYT